MYNDSKELYEYVNDAIYSINGCVMEEGCNILELDLMLFRYLVNGFVEGAAAWQEWVLQEMAGYVKTVVSDVYWKTLKRGGGSVFFKAFPTVEQQFWITQNEHKEEESLVHLILNIRESVLPFMNPDLWKRTKDYEKNRRDNSEYENQRNDMLTGKFFEKNTNVKKEDALDTLDIIQ